VCGKFVYDSVNNTVRLPLVTGKLDGTTDVNTLGDLEPLMVKLPNITGSVQITSGSEGPTSGGALYLTPYGRKAPNADAGGYLVNIDASRSSSVYSGNGTDTTIHEQAINVLYYIVVATSTKTDIQVDIDEIATDLNMKVDKSQLVEAHVVVETYQNGTSWYYVRDDKFCIQGGMINSLSNGSTSTVNFLKLYAIPLGAGAIGNYTRGAVISLQQLTNASATFQLYQAQDNTAANVYWFAFGYIA
jgi:hypothetical protein